MTGTFHADEIYGVTAGISHLRQFAPPSPLRAAADRMDEALSLDDGEEGDDGAAEVAAAVRRRR